MDVLPFSFLNGEDIQDEGADSHQGRNKDRADEDGKQEDTGPDYANKANILLWFNNDSKDTYFKLLEGLFQV